MTEIVCPGLDGTNPLHVLAALGVLRLTIPHDAQATLAWRWMGHWTPVIGHVIDAWPNDDLAATCIAADIQALAVTGSVDSALGRRVTDLKSERKKAEESRKKALQVGKAEMKDLPTDDRRSRMDALAAEHDRIIVGIQQGLDQAQDCLNDALGSGIAHLGTIIGVPPPLFRRKAFQACNGWLQSRSEGTQAVDPALLAWALASQASDGVSDRGLVSPTPLSFSNGSSGQCLLKDFRGCATRCTGAAVLGTWQGNPVGDQSITGLNWDPADQRSYALQWDSPESGRAHDPAVNALAFVGLAELTTMPGSSGLLAVGWQRGRPESFRWPIWDTPLRSSLIRSLLARRIPDDRRDDPPGVVARYQSERINPTGKRNFFAPARPI